MLIPVHKNCITIILICIFNTLAALAAHGVAFCPGDTDTEDGDWEIKMSPLDPEVINTH